VLDPSVESAYCRASAILEKVKVKVKVKAKAKEGTVPYFSSVDSDTPQRIGEIGDCP